MKSNRIIEELNKKFKLQLNGRMLVPDEKYEKYTLNDDEIYLIGYFLSLKKSGYHLPMIVHVSRTHYLDFIGYDMKQYNDVSIAKWSKRKNIRDI